jgi:polar amino acid transport system permease protein
MLASFSLHLFWDALSSRPFWRGALLALEITCVSFAVAIVIGFFLALGRNSRSRAVRGGVFLYTWFFRATPTLLQLLFVWDALPQIWGTFRHGWFTPFLAATIALSLNEGAYMAEIIRSGLLSVDPGQELAGRALGMPRRRILRRIVVPQAVRIVIPPMGNEFITLLKLTSLASVRTTTRRRSRIWRRLPRRRSTTCSSCRCSCSSRAGSRSASRSTRAAGRARSPLPVSLRSRTTHDEHPARL